eukprot:s1037_g2.t1
MSKKCTPLSCGAKHIMLGALLDVQRRRFVWQAQGILHPIESELNVWFCGVFKNDGRCGIFEYQIFRFAMVILRDRCGTYGIGLALGAALVAVGAAPLLRVGDICLTFVWQVWHLVTSTSLSCGRPGTYGTGLALGAALVAWGLLWLPWSPLGRRLVAVGASYAWQAWQLATVA